MTRNALRDVSYTPEHLPHTDGMDKLAAEWAKLARDANATVSARLNVLNTMMHMAAVADLERVQIEQRENPPEAVIRQFHADGELVPVLQEMHAEGTLTLEMNDPPGC